MRIKQAYKNDVETIKNTLGYEFINYIATPYYDNAKFGTSVNGVTVTLNKNNSLMLTGTSTASTVIQLHHRLNETFILPKGKYILNGLDDTFEGVNIAIRVVKTVDNSPVEIASIYSPNQEKYFELEEDTQVGIYIEFPVGTTFINHIVRAMIRLSYVLDKSYKEYKQNIINSNKWKYGGVIEGANIVELSSICPNWEELYILMPTGDEANCVYCITFDMKRITINGNNALSDRKNIYNGFYVSSTDYTFGCVEITNTKIRNVYRQKNGANTISTCKTIFYWR